MSRFFEEQNGNENDSKIAGTEKHDGCAQAGQFVSRRAVEVCSSEKRAG